jgi:hypothetical protein
MPLQMKPAVLVMYRTLVGLQLPPAFIRGSGPGVTYDDAVLSENGGRHVEVTTGLLAGVDIAWDPIAVGVEINPRPWAYGSG